MIAVSLKCKEEAALWFIYFFNKVNRICGRFNLNLKLSGDVNL